MQTGKKLGDPLEKLVRLMDIWWGYIEELIIFKYNKGIVAMVLNFSPLEPHANAFMD
jgi:hypothetical protein